MGPLSHLSRSTSLQSRRHTFSVQRALLALLPLPGLNFSAVRRRPPLRCPLTACGFLSSVLAFSGDTTEEASLAGRW